MPGARQTVMRSERTTVRMQVAPIGLDGWQELMSRS
jgi:hypothetical protein